MTNRIYSPMQRKETPLYAFSVSGCVGMALMVAMTISGLVGTVIPVFFNKINVDPAVASGPLISTVSEMCIRDRGSA